MKSWYKRLLLSVQNFFKKSKKSTNQLITNNTGVSVKSWLIYVIGITCIILLLVVPVVLLYDVLHDGKVDSNISYIAEYVTSIGVVLVSGVLPKVADEIATKFKKEKND